MLVLLKNRKEIINLLIQMYSHVYIWKDIALRKQGFGLSLAFGSSRFQGSWPFSWPLQAQVFSLFLAFSSSRFQGFWPFLGSCRLKASRFLASLVAFGKLKVSGLLLAFGSPRFQDLCPFLGLASSRFQGPSPQFRGPSPQAPRFQGSRVQAPKLQGSRVQTPKLQGSQVQASKLSGPLLVKKPKPPQNLFCT